MNLVSIDKLPSIQSIEGSEYLPAQYDKTYKVTVQQILDKSKEINRTYYSYKYNDLKLLKDSKLLECGKTYILTDYQCIYKQPVTDNIIVTPYDGWLIALRAISNNEFSVDVDIYFEEDSQYILEGGIPIIKSKYLFDNFSDYSWSCEDSKGVIIEMVDSNNNKCDYDFKHIKFRRWAVKDVTENNNYGSSQYPAAYRCYGTDEEPKRNDGRTWVGSGLDIERDYIRYIFNGTFIHNLWNQTAQHEDYIKYIHKPYLNGSDVKYIAFTQDLSEVSNLTAAVPGLEKFSIDTEDYIDAFTFEKGRKDFSNLCHDNTISCIVTNNGSKQLPNTVFIADDRIADSNISGYFYDNYVRGKYNTFTLYTDPNNVIVPYINGVRFNRANYNIFQSIRMRECNFSTAVSNYTSASFYKVSIEYFTHNVMFGYYTGVKGRSSTYNLLFGQNFCNITSDRKTNTSVTDGNYWYDVEIQDWFGYNIMAPFQYSVFYPHTNTNFIKLPYNKGVTLKGTFQDNFIERMRWGVTVEYGAIQGNYMKELYGCTISSSAFASQLAHSSGVSSIYKLQGAVQIPNIFDADVKASSCSAKTFVPALTGDQKAAMENRSKKKLISIVGSTTKIIYYDQL